MGIMYREKPPEEIITVLGEQAEEAENDLDLPSRYWDKSEKLMRWIDVEEETYNSFREKFDSEQLKNQIDTVYERADEARACLREGDAEGLRDYLEEVGMMEKELYEENFELADFSDIELDEDKRIDFGGCADVYEVKNSQKALVLRGSSDEDLWHIRAGLRRYIRHRQVPEEVNFARIEEVGIKDGHLAELMEKASGEEVHREKEDYDRWSEMNEKMAEAPLEAYKEFVESARILAFYNLDVDRNKGTNFFYDSDTQEFTHIDNNSNRIHDTQFHRSLITPVAAARDPRRFDSGEVTQEDIDNTKTIIQKFNEAGDPQGEEKNQEAINILKDLSPEVDFERETPSFDTINNEEIEELNKF